jgi:putative flippase GtrA
MSGRGTPGRRTSRRPPRIAARRAHRHTLLRRFRPLGGRRRRGRGAAGRRTGGGWLRAWPAGVLPAGLRARARRLLPPRTRAVLPEIAGFALAGGAAYAADLGLFIWLRGHAGMGPLSAKALSFLAGCGVAYNGNALGTYRRRVHATPRARRYGVFFAVNAAGAGVQLLCLVLSHYLLGFTSPRADVVSGGAVGMALATALRFWGTRTLVFRTAARGTRGVRRADEGSRPSWTG